jgi:CDP-diacylglycerol--glycerol-3-phosphate 3-phosphatidyltransferase
MKPKVLNIPNRITCLRLIIAIISFVLMLTNKWVPAFILILIAVLLDIIDGKVARKLGQVTTQGVFLDIMVDKIVIISTFLIIGLKINRIFFYLGILMLIREYSIDTMRAIAASNRKVITSDKLSKIKGILFMTSMILMIGNYTLNYSHTPLSITVTYVAIIMAIIGIIFSYLTLVRFIRSYRKIIE